MARDNIYGTPQKPVAPFQFDRQVAGVFDDMIRRSVLFYDEIIRRHSFKRENGYSELEISQKREALEKVLVPETVETHGVRLSQAGFASFDMWLKWFNFAAFIAVKPGT